MQLPGWFNLKFKDILIVVLILGLFIRGEFRKPPEARIETKTTVQEIHHDTVIVKQPIVTQTIVEKNIPTKYIPSKNDDTLKKQYGEILSEFSNKNIYVDTTKVDSIGWIRVEDTVQYNKILAKKISYDIKEKIVTTTITIHEPYKPKNQFFIGGEVGGTTQGSINELELGLLFKNKKDRILGIAGGYDFGQNSPLIKLKYYQKIKL